MRFHKELCYLIGSHELYFKLLLVYQAIVPARKHIGMIFEVKKKKETWLNTYMKKRLQ